MVNNLLKPEWIWFWIANSLEGLEGILHWKELFFKFCLIYRMRPNYLPNPGTNHKILHKFVNFHQIEPKFGGLLGLSCSFPVINVSPLALKTASTLGLNLAQMC